MKALRVFLFLAVFLAALPGAFGQQVYYTGQDATGQLALTRTVNALQKAQTSTISAKSLRFPELTPRPAGKRLHPPVTASFSTLALADPPMQSLAVVPGPASTGFNGLSHFDQRLANSGNQFSVEPPNPSIAVGNGYILQGVNNAIQVYNTSGIALLPRVLSSNELFGVPAAIDRITGINGVFPTDMRVYFDHGINRWFVLQRSQDNDAAGNLLYQSHLYLAVSQTPDPTGTYNIYTADTTNYLRPGCPCLPDYPQIGSDEYGFYISANQYSTVYDSFINASILALSKASLASGAASPRAVKFEIPFTTGYEFAIQPATTPPGGSYFLGNGGLEYFVSTAGSFSSGNRVAVWAMTNTSSLATSQPNPSLTKITVPTLSYTSPYLATQPPGSRPYGASLVPPGALPFIEGGDTRALSVSYAAGRLYLSFATQVQDETGRSLVGGALVIFSPTFRSGVLAAPVLKQNYLLVKSNHLLFPAVAVNAQGRGAIAATLVGPDWYPSAAFIPIDTFSNPTTVRVAAAGQLPEDGFTGYPGGFAPGIARWGDYSAAVITGDGSVWMATEYIGNLPRTEFANWGTFIMRTQP